MKIKRYHESLMDDMNISNERNDEIILDLTNISTMIDSNREKMESLSNELSHYKSKSKESNDQIDDSVINLDLAKSKLDEVIASIDSVVNNLKSYNENGRKYLY